MKRSKPISNIQWNGHFLISIISDWFLFVFFFIFVFEQWMWTIMHFKMGILFLHIQNIKHIISHSNSQMFFHLLTKIKAFQRNSSKCCLEWKKLRCILKTHSKIVDILSTDLHHIIMLRMKSMHQFTNYLSRWALWIVCHWKTLLFNRVF